MALERENERLRQQLESAESQLREYKAQYVHFWIFARNMVSSRGVSGCIESSIFPTVFGLFLPKIKAFSRRFSGSSANPPILNLSLIHI